MIYWANGSEPYEDGDSSYDSKKNLSKEKVTHTMKMHGETAILVPSHVTMTGIEKMLEIIHSLPKTQRKQENDYTYRASIKVNNIPVIIYYFELSHLSLSEREGFILDTIKEVLENKDLGDNAIIIGTPVT